ncbi:hypothetical protein [Vibrio navarrensis]|uniref:hypothetical protein n=1 Tax=Vibrio navarrensis TaxID=29495 RepID=UPI00186969FC|nr:hypothetical protein [Vibrio navarrensis]MBE3654965.1 hypothetical protein [Vibrio navarrensis]
MESLNWNDWIALVSSVGTFLSSIFVLVTLFELRKQRKQSYLPDFAVPDVCFNYNNSAQTHIKMWSMDDGNMLSLKVINIGKGVAKDIKFTWEYDMHDMFEKFHELDFVDNVVLQHDTDENRLLYIQDNNVMDNSSLSTDDRQLDYLLTPSDGGDAYVLDLPGSYLSISTAIYKNAKINELFNSEEFETSLSPLTLNVEFKDVGGSRIVKKYSVQLCFFNKSIKNNRSMPNKIEQMRGRVYVSAL